MLTKQISGAVASSRQLIVEALQRCLFAPYHNEYYDTRSTVSHTCVVLVLDLGIMFDYIASNSLFSHTRVVFRRNSNRAVDYRQLHKIILGNEKNHINMQIMASLSHFPLMFGIQRKHFLIHCGKTSKQEFKDNT